MKLTGKFIIYGQIETLTGLHIGGSKTSMDIGEVDLNVIKSPKGVPFIPGSSLKGKMRSLLAKTEGKMDVNDDNRYIKEIFGSAADQDKDIITRLIVRDAALNSKAFEADFQDVEMDFEYSSIKFENRIDRRTGTAKDPRQLERVPAGAKFDFEIVYDVYDDVNAKIDESSSESRLKKHLWALHRAMQLLQDDYLGGQGSRGYGKVRFLEMKAQFKSIAQNYTVQELEGEMLDFATKIQELHKDALQFQFAE
jgi:CRISPR-associated protein Csm3